jgi:hypothetical protein
MSYCDLPEFYATAETKARQRHRCCECHAWIEVGERYLTIRGKWDGGIDTYRQHLLCARACEFARDHLDEECIPFGGLFEWWGECHLGRYWSKDWQEFRDMLAQIIRRQRGTRK